MNIGYSFFVRTRPCLHRRSSSIDACADSPYREIQPPKNAQDDKSNPT